MELVKVNSTSRILKIFLRDSSTGQGKTGVAAASMSGVYSEGNSALVSLSFSPGAVGDAYSANKWAEAGQGFYYYHAPNVMWDQLGKVPVKFSASGAIDAKTEFQVVGFDPDSTLTGGSALSGPYTVAITVNDGTNPIQNALVRMHRTGESETKQTNSSGQVAAPFTVVGATWSVSITAAGFVGQTFTLAVSANATPTYSLVPLAISSPSVPGLCTVAFFVRHNANEVTGASVTAEIVDEDSTTDGWLQSRAVAADITNGSGYAELQLVKSSLFTAGSGAYRIRVQDPVDGKVLFDRVVIIPDSDTVNAEDLVDYAP